MSSNPATFEPTAQSDDEVLDEDAHAPFDGVECEVGGYLVRARRTATWDAVVTLLHVLAADHGDYFHAVMQGCRRLSNSTPEIDGLDELLLEPEQQLHDVALERESRRTQVGYATPADARAFLELARRPRHHRSDAGPASNPIAAAYFRAADEAASSAADRSVRPQRTRARTADVCRRAESLAAVVDLLAAAGLMPERPRALLEGADSQPSRCAQMRRLMACLGDTDDTAYLRAGSRAGVSGQHAHGRVLGAGQIVHNPGSLRRGRRHLQSRSRALAGALAGRRDARPSVGRATPRHCPRRFWRTTTS